MISSHAPCFRLAAVALLIAGLAVDPAKGQAPDADRHTMYERYLQWHHYAGGGTIEAHWMPDGSSFWYAEDVGAHTHIWLVDPVTNTRRPFFNVDRLRAALTSALGREPVNRGVPFRDFRLVSGGAQVEFELEGRHFVMDLAEYSLSVKDRRKEPVRSSDLVSPDRRWAVTIRDRNLWLISMDDGNAVQWTTDGTEGVSYDLESARWSPDGSHLAVIKLDSRHLPCQPIVRNWLRSAQRAEIRWWCAWSLPGDPRARFELVLIERASGSGQRIALSGDNERPVHLLTWHPDGSEFYVLDMDRYQRKVRLLAIDVRSRAPRVVLTETSETLVQTWVPWSWRPRPIHFLTDGSRFIWTSERDGWSHLYLYDRDGRLLRQLTSGEFPALRVVAVDEAAEVVYFTARTDRLRPYDAQLCQVDLNGRGFRIIDTGAWGTGPGGMSHSSPT